MTALFMIIATFVLWLNYCELHKFISNPCGSEKHAETNSYCELHPPLYSEFLSTVAWNEW